MTTSGTVTLSQLESHLWEAANILRGPVDAADFKSYVFPLLFFKRISDVHDEEHATALKQFDGDDGATKCGPAIPMAATSPACRLPRAATSRERGRGVRGGGEAGWDERK